MLQVIRPWGATFLQLGALLSLLSGCGPEGAADESAVTQEESNLATGYWRLGRVAISPRSWMISPKGKRQFVLGVNSVLRDTRCDGIATYLHRMAPRSVADREWARLSTGVSGSEQVSAPLFFNSVGSFSETNDLDATGGRSPLVRARSHGGSEAPYTKVLSPAPRGTDRALKNAAGEVLEAGVSGAWVGDPFNPAFLADLDRMVAQDVLPYRDDPGLQAWYAGNETGMFDKGGREVGVRDFRQWLWSDVPAGSTIDRPRCARHALADFLRVRYASDLAQLNAAWARQYTSFTGIVTGAALPIPYSPGEGPNACNLNCRQDLQRFVHDRLLPEWVRRVTTKIRAVDANHLVASPRLAVGTFKQYRFYAPGVDVWTDSGVTLPRDVGGVSYGLYDLLRRQGDAGFDFVALNIYRGAETFESPWLEEGLRKIAAEAQQPVMISEFSVRARLPGWSNLGGAPSFVPTLDTTEDQLQRGLHYRSQLLQFLSVKDVIGANWHAWSDRYTAASPDSQINMGLFQCDDAARGLKAGTRWSAALETIAATNRDVPKWAGE